MTVLNRLATNVMLNLQSNLSCHIRFKHERYRVQFAFLILETNEFRFDFGSFFGVNFKRINIIRCLFVFS